MLASRGGRVAILDLPSSAGLPSRPNWATPALVALTLPTDLHVFPTRLGRPSDFAALVASFMENELRGGEVVRLDAATRL